MRRLIKFTIKYSLVLGLGWYANDYFKDSTKAPNAFTIERSGVDSCPDMDRLVKQVKRMNKVQDRIMRRIKNG